MPFTPTRWLKKLGGTLTGLLQFSGTTHAGIKLNALTTVQRDALTASNGMLIYNTTTARLEMYQGGAWVNYAKIVGDTMTGLLQWSGTGHAGLKLNSLTTAQRDALTPANGMLIYNTTTNKVQRYENGAWGDIAGAVSSVFGRTGAVVATPGDYNAGQVTNTPAGNIASTTVQAAINELDSEKVKVAGDTMTGLLQWSGTTHAGLKLLSLTTVQRDALTPSNGMLIYNTTTATVQKYEAEAWKDVATTGGALANWTESNGTFGGQEFTKLSPSSASANVTAIVQPKGTGAFQLQEPDGTATGGHVRGSYAVDLSTSRSLAIQVAASTYSVAIGTSVEASATGAVSIGRLNKAIGAYSFAGGLQSLTDVYGQRAWAAGNVAADIGSMQFSEFILFAATTNGTQTELLTGSTERLVLRNNTTWAFSILIVARRTDAAGENAAYKFEGCIKRDANAASTAIVGSVTKTVLAEDTAAWDADVNADTANGTLRIQVTGEAAKTIHWVARVETSEVTG